MEQDSLQSTHHKVRTNWALQHVTQPRFVKCHQRYMNWLQVSPITHNLLVVSVVIVTTLPNVHSLSSVTRST